MVICKDLADHIVIARIAVKQLQSLLVAYREKIDKNNFFQNLLLDNLLLVDVYNRAKKLHMDIAVRRAVILVEVQKECDNSIQEMLKNMFSQQSGDFVTSVDEHNLIVIKQLEPDEDYDDLILNKEFNVGDRVILTEKAKEFCKKLNFSWWNDKDFDKIYTISKISGKSGKKDYQLKELRGVSLSKNDLKPVV